ncbi:MAG: hypothetical protein H6948_02220 [Zoogloeaceae bacterium]|nr:hypothetical protein [Zoogloeaceae bacterium]
MRRYPYLVGDKASNKPDASTAYNIAATALAGGRTFASALSAGDVADGDEFLIRAYQYDANGNPTGAWEVVWCTFTDAATDTLTRGTLVLSSTGSKIDWSTATGADFAPALEVIGTGASGSKVSQKAAVSSAASYDIELRAGCSYLVFFDALDLSNDQITVEMLVSTDGSTFDNGASDYAWGANLTTTSGPSGAGSAADTSMDWSSTWFGNANDGEELSGRLFIHSAGNSGTHTKVEGRAVLQSYLGTSAMWNFYGERLASQADVALRIQPQAGTFSGNFTVWEFEG